jgi:hypothetical protein
MLSRFLTPTWPGFSIVGEGGKPVPWFAVGNFPFAEKEEHCQYDGTEIIEIN